MDTKERLALKPYVCADGSFDDLYNVICEWSQLSPHNNLNIKKSNMNKRTSHQDSKKYDELKQKLENAFKKYGIVTEIDHSNGTFAKVFIPKNTIIGKCVYELNMDSTPGVIDLFKISDLAGFDGITKEEYITHAKNKTNVIVVNLFGRKYLKAIKNIQIGEELSRCYGWSLYWKKNILMYAVKS